MLVSLSIQNVVLIERLTLRFDEGLTVLTGETGAGKSILLDALGLALGARGDSGLVRRNTETAIVGAEFTLTPDHPVAGALDELGLPATETLVVRRVLSADGRSRAFVNDQPVGVGVLRRIGMELVEVHGQFDTQGLLDMRTHRAVLDAYAGLETLAAQVAAAHRSWRQVDAARQTAATETDRARAEEDYLQHAVAELDELAPRVGEEAELAERRSFLMNRENLAKAVGAAYAEIGGERGAGRSLATALRLLSRLIDRAGGRLDGAVAALERAAAECAEAEAQLAALASTLDDEAEGLEKLEDRIFALRAAARKHSVAVESLAGHRDALAQRLTLTENQADTLARLTRQAAQARESFVAVATGLREARLSAAAELDRAVARELAPLKLDKARFETGIEALDETDWGPHGLDRVGFRVATNPGMPPGPLNRIASGGELARFMLALKVVLARSGTVPTLVFDEVDTGIGGAVAAAVGDRLVRLGRDLQVLVVTHSPQVAARGNAHWQIRKSTVEDRVNTEVVTLDTAQRREEIARMLSGAHVTDEARAAATALLTATVS